MFIIQTDTIICIDDLSYTRFCKYIPELSSEVVLHYLFIGGKRKEDKIILYFLTISWTWRLACTTIGGLLPSFLCTLLFTHYEAIIF